MIKSAQNEMISSLEVFFRSPDFFGIFYKIRKEMAEMFRG